METNEVIFPFFSIEGDGEKENRLRYFLGATPRQRCSIVERNFRFARADSGIVRRFIKLRDTLAHCSTVKGKRREVTAPRYRGT